MKHRVGLLSLSDSRDRVYEGLAPVINQYNDQLVEILEATGEVEVVRGTAPIASPADARQEARRLVQAQVGGTIFQQPIFGFPHFGVIAAQILHPPFLVLSPREPNYPSVNGVLTVGSAFAQLDIPHIRIWDNIQKPQVLKQVMAFIRAGSAIHRLKGQVFGLLGGRSMGLYGAAPAPNTWLRQFGVDVDHVDQLEIVRRAELIDPKRVAEGVKWLTENMGDIQYDDQQLTASKLEFQVRTYLATKDIIADYGWDFLGIKCHYEMSEYQVTQCLSASFLNDPYDWEGPKVPTPASCEADSDGALTMQMLRLLTDDPVALLDIRFYNEATDRWVFVNCGAAPTWFSERSEDPTVNLASAQLKPATPKFFGGGAHVCLEFKPGPVTLARLQRSGDDYQLLILEGELEPRPDGDVPGTGVPWPLAFARLSTPVDRLFQVMNANHLHLVVGDYTQDLRLAAQFLGVEVVDLT